MRNLCTERTAVFWVAPHTCCVSRSHHRISERHKGARIQWRCFVAGHCSGHCHTFTLRFLAHSIFGGLFVLSQCVTAGENAWHCLSIPPSPSHRHHTFLFRFPAHSISCVFGVPFVHSVTRDDGAVEPHEWVLMDCALQVNPVPPSVKSVEAAELCVVFSKIPFSFGFFLMLNVRVTFT